MPLDESRQKALQKLLEEHRLFAETPLYREAMRDALIPTPTPGVFRLSANPAPAESVVDVYGQGYVVQAEQVGPGLAFAESDQPNWQETMEMRAMKMTKTSRATASANHVEVNPNRRHPATRWTRVSRGVGHGGARLVLHVAGRIHRGSGGRLRTPIDSETCNIIRSSLCA